MENITLPAGTPAALHESTLCAAFQTTVALRGDAVALRTRGDATRIISSGGKNMSPANIEARIKTSSLLMARRA